MLVAAVTYLCLFNHLGALGLVGPDEPRYVEVAREMAESGDWVTPHLYGRPWFEKPALYYWGAAAAFRVFGVHEIAARLPSALAAALATLVLAWAGRRFFNLRTAWIVLLIYPTCSAGIGFAHVATPDMLFTAALAAAMVAALAVLQSALLTERTDYLACAAFGFFLGAAALAKGPAGPVLASGSAGLWTLGSRRWRTALRLAHPVAIGVFCLTALPWYVLCAARNPEFLRTFLIFHNWERYMTPVFRHQQPLWFFGRVLLLGLLPWTVLLAGVVRDARRAWRQNQWTDSAGLFLACWALFPVLLFTFSKSKLPDYVLPAVPPLALLLARSSARAIEDRGAFGRMLFGGVGITFVAVAAFSGHWLKRLPGESGLANSQGLLAWLVLVVAGGLCAALLALLRRPAAALLAAALLMATVVEAANRLALPQLDAYLSPRAAARVGQAHFKPGEVVSVYRLHRAWQYGLSFYLRRELIEWSSPSPRPVWLYTNAAGLAELQRWGIKCAVVERGFPKAILLHLEP